MRISDWSSDVCSSDLLCIKARIRGKAALLERPNALELLSCLPLLCGSGSKLGLLFAVRHRRDHLALSHIATIGEIQADHPLRDRRGNDPLFIGELIGRASCRERVCESVEFSGVAVT